MGGGEALFPHATFTDRVLSFTWACGLIGIKARCRGSLIPNGLLPTTDLPEKSYPASPLTMCFEVDTHESSAKVSERRMRVQPQVTESWESVRILWTHQGPKLRRFVSGELFHFQLSRRPRSSEIASCPISPSNSRWLWARVRFDELPPIALGPTRNLAQW